MVFEGLDIETLPFALSTIITSPASLFTQNVIVNFNFHPDFRPENAASYQAQVPRPEDNLEPGHTPQHPYETSGAAQVNPVPFPTYVSPTHQDVRGGTSQTQSKEQEAPEAYWQSCQSQVYRSNTEKRLPPFHTEQRTHQSSSVPLGSARSTRLHLNHLSFKDKQLVMSALRKTSLNLNCLDLLQVISQLITSESLSIRRHPVI